MKIESDSVEAFLHDMIEEKPKNFIKKTDMYSHYEEYCKRETRQPQGKQAFHKSMEIKGYKIRKRDGYDGYRNIDIAFRRIDETVFDNK